MKKSTDQNDICPDVLRIRFDQDSMIWDLEDGRSVSVPLSWYPYLMLATPAERADHFIVAYSAHWPSLDCSLDSEGILRGRKEAPYFAKKAWKRHDLRHSVTDTHLTAA
jgi:hypothetical protein